MSETQKTSFRFVNFFVRESHIQLFDQGEFNVEVNIAPKGTVLKSLNQFHLELNVKIKEATNKFDISIVAVAIFEFDENAEIEKYKNNLFTLNAPAIAFPYIRAYITNLTAQSGLFTVTLPTLNLSALGSELKSNITVTD